MLSPTVIFATDNQQDIAANYRAEKYLAGLVAMQKAETITPLIGCYKGKMERSWSMSRKDFTEHVEMSEFVAKQESFLVVYGDPRYQAELYFKNGLIEPIGYYTEFHYGDIPKYEAWTYNPFHDIYFTFTEEKY